MKANNSDRKRGSTKGKNRVSLPEMLQRQLNAYALVAGAAGVAVLACASSAEAAPVCKDLSIQLTSPSSYPFNPAEQVFAPFQVAQTGSWYFSSYGRFWNWNRAFFTPNSAGANVLIDADHFAVNLDAGAPIGPEGAFARPASYGLLFTYGKGFYAEPGGGTLLKHRGNLDLQRPTYVGFRFSKAGKLHYGWARLRVTAQQIKGTSGRQTNVHILGYGYEATPNTAITAGSCRAPAASEDVQGEATVSSQPESHARTLGDLAAGALGRGSTPD